MAIPLQVKNKASVLESLENFVEGEMLEGDNAYHCEKCDYSTSRKSSYQKHLATQKHKMLQNART